MNFSALQQNCIQKSKSHHKGIDPKGAADAKFFRAS